MQVHVVVTTTGGFAREDGASASALAAFTDPKVADQVRMLWGPSASVHPVEVDVIPKGVRDMAVALGLMSEPSGPATPAEGAPHAG